MKIHYSWVYKYNNFLNLKKIIILFLNFLLYNISKSVINIRENKNVFNDYEKMDYEYLFDTIDSDYYDLSLVYKWL